MAYFDRAMVKDVLEDYKGAIEDYIIEIRIDYESIDSYF